MESIKKLISIKSSAVFAYRNWVKIRQNKKFTNTTINGIIYRGFTKSDEVQIFNLYSHLNNGAKFSWSRRLIYRALGSCMLLIAERQTDFGSEIIGMNMYYLNERDLKDNTIHEGFIGVLPEMTGKGIATNMRQTAKQNFKKNGFNGISTRISLDNHSSLKSAINIGFKPLEKYIDSYSGEARYYMICDLMG